MPISGRTSGIELKKTLGLDKFKDVYIGRVILPHSQKINIIFYDSVRSNLAKNKALIPPFNAMVYSGKDLKHGNYLYPLLTPLLDIEVWNGIPQNYMFVLSDLGYQKLINSKNFSKLPEGIQDKYLESSVSYYFPKNKLQELTLYDLKTQSAISPFTMKWRKDRNRTMGSENRTAKFIDVFISEADNSVTFAFQTAATELNGKAPSDTIDSNYKYYDTPKKRVSPYDLGKTPLIPNKEKKYEVQIKILKFFDWLSVFDGETIGPKQLKEILQVSDCQVFSTMPAFHWQGANYYASQIDVSAYPTDIAPIKKWGAIHGTETFLSKDLYGIINQIDFFINPMSSMLTKKLKDRNLI